MSLVRLLLCSILLSPPLFAQPQEAGTFRPAELVEIIRLDSTIRLDIRYASPNNFMKRPMYAEARAFLQEPAAAALVRVHKTLRKKGFGLLVFDGYRPWSVTKKFWDETPPEAHKFVANPRKGSRHNRGCGVDLSLYELASGREVVMPSSYDEFSNSSAADYAGGTRPERTLRDLLRTAMKAEGFTVNPDEWWHFDYKDWKMYRILNIPFSTLR